MNFFVFLAVFFVALFLAIGWDNWLDHHYSECPQSPKVVTEVHDK